MQAARQTNVTITCSHAARRGSLAARIPRSHIAWHATPREYPIFPTTNNHNPSWAIDCAYRQHQQTPTSTEHHRIGQWRRCDELFHSPRTRRSSCSTHKSPTNGTHDGLSNAYIGTVARAVLTELPRETPMQRRRVRYEWLATSDASQRVATTHSSTHHTCVDRIRHRYRDTCTPA